MTSATFRPGIIADVQVRTLAKYTDERGWLCELFRADELPQLLHPAMGYLSLTEPWVVRGPHEHRQQTDHFCFLGPAPFQMHMWDNRASSATFNVLQELTIPASEPTCVIVPPGVVHAYQNIGDVPGLLLNFPNQLYRGPNKRDAVDEIRHEEDPFSPFKMQALPRRVGARKGRKLPGDFLPTSTAAGNGT